MIASDALPGINRGIIQAQAPVAGTPSWALRKLLRPDRPLRNDLHALPCPLAGALPPRPCQVGGGYHVYGTVLGIRCLVESDAVDELLKEIRNGDIYELTLHDLKLPDGTRIAQARAPHEQSRLREPFQASRAEKILLTAGRSVR